MGLWGRFFQATAELVEAGVGSVYTQKPCLRLDEWAISDPDQSYIRTHMNARGSLLCFVPTKFPSSEIAEDERGM